MGVIDIEGTVRGTGKCEARLRFLVDSGTQYTLIPEGTWKQLKLRSKRTAAFQLADGTTIERDISECHLSLPQGETHTPVILGQPGDEPLLGVITLEELGLVLNPFSRELQPMRLIL